MARSTLKSALASLALVGTLSVAAVPRATHAASWPYLNPPNCIGTSVVLRGNLPPTVTCLLYAADATPTTVAGATSGIVLGQQIARHPFVVDGARPASAGRQRPNIQPGACSSSAMEFFENYNYGAPYICFFGYGTADLYAFGDGHGGNFNDDISSYVNGNVYAGNLYADPDRSGRYIPIDFNAHGYNLTDQGFNDVATSVCIRGPGVACGNPGSN